MDLNLTTDELSFRDETSARGSFPCPEGLERVA